MPPRSSSPPKHAALARKLTGGGSIPPTSRGTTGASKAVRSEGRAEARPEGVPSSTSPSVSGAASEREKIYAARRDSLIAKAADSVDDDRPRSTPPRAPGQPKWVKAALAVALASALVALGVHVKRTLDEGSDDGRVRSALMAWEFAPRDPAAREAAFAEIDKLGPSAVSSAVELLVDERPAEKGGSRSTRRIQELANTYLLRCAANAKADPPPQATQVTQQIFDGNYPPQAAWSSLRDAWRKWLDDARARGLVPKA